MTPKRVPDHVERGLTLMLSQYKDRPLLAAWVESYLKQVQALDDATYNVLVSRLLDRAKNAQLDLIGKLVDEKRANREDDVYRIFIAARIAVNRSVGRIADILTVLTALTTARRQLIDQAPANMRLELLEVPTLSPDDILRMLRDAKAGGVGLTMITPTVPTANQFRFKSVGAADVPGQGFGSSTDTTSTGGLVSDVTSAR